MAGNFIKVTILFVVIYQVTQLNEATTLNRPSAENAVQSSASAENVNQLEDVAESSTSGENANPPLLGETSNSLAPAATDENPDSSELEKPSGSSAADENANPQPLGELSDPITSETPGPSDADGNKNANLTPTDPLEINKMAFQPLVTHFGPVGPLIYDLLTDKNALGEQLAVVSKLITDRIPLHKYTTDINLILSNLLNPEVKDKVKEIYEKIKDVEAQDTTNRKLQDAVEIITNIINDESAVNEIDNIIKTSPV